MRIIYIYIYVRICTRVRVKYEYNGRGIVKLPAYMISYMLYNIISSNCVARGVPVE